MQKVLRTARLTGTFRFDLRPDRPGSSIHDLVVEVGCAQRRWTSRRAAVRYAASASSLDLELRGTFWCVVCTRVKRAIRWIDLGHRAWR
jgi:hypothetical protein